MPAPNSADGTVFSYTFNNVMLNGGSAQNLAGLPGLLAQSAVAIPLTGTTAQTTLVTIPVPILSANSALRILTAWTFPNSTNSKTLGVQLSGSSIRNFVQAGSGAAQENFQDVMINRGLVNSQISILSLSSGGNVSDQVVTAVDTSVPTNLTITAQLGLSTETITLQAYLVEILRP